MFRSGSRRLNCTRCPLGRSRDTAGASGLDFIVCCNDISGASEDHYTFAVRLADKDVSIIARKRLTRRRSTRPSLISFSARGPTRYPERVLTFKHPEGAAAPSAAAVVAIRCKSCVGEISGTPATEPHLNASAGNRKHHFHNERPVRHVEQFSL